MKSVWVAAVMAAGCGLWGCGDRGSGGEAGLEVTKVLGEVGLSPGQFTYPRVLESDGKGLWVIDKAAHVQRLDPATGDASAFWQMPDFNMGKPCGATVGPDGLLYVADTHYFRIMAYLPPTALDGKPELVSQWGAYGEGPGQFIYPTDVAFAGAGEELRIYVSEYGGNDRVSVFDKDHTFLFAIGKFGYGDGEGIEFNRPQSIGIVGDRLAVADACNHRIGVFSLDGKLVRWIGGGVGEGADQFAYPYGLVVRADHTALVSEFGNHRVHHVDLETGASLGVYGRPGRGRGEFTNPWAITVIDEMVYVLDSGNARVQAFRAPKMVRKAG